MTSHTVTYTKCFDVSQSGNLLSFNGMKNIGGTTVAKAYIISLANVEEVEQFGTDPDITITVTYANDDDTDGA